MPVEPEPVEPEPVEPELAEPELAGARAGRGARRAGRGRAGAAGRAGLVRGAGQGQGQRPSRHHASHGDRGRRGPDLGPAALPGRLGLADPVVSACSAHVLILRSRTRKSLHEPSGSAMNRAGSSRSCGPRLPRQHEGHLKETLASAHRAWIPCSACSPPSAIARRTSGLPSLRHRRYRALRIPASLLSQGSRARIARVNFCHSGIDRTAAIRHECRVHAAQATWLGHPSRRIH